MTAPNEWKPDCSSREKLEEQLKDMEALWLDSYDRDPYSDETADYGRKVGELKTTMSFHEVPKEEIEPSEYSQEMGMGRVVLNTARIFLT